MAHPAWGRGDGTSKKVASPGFPEQHIMPFFHALRRRTAVQGRGMAGLTDEELCCDYDVMGFLYFLALAFGALRASEPLHWFLDDIQPDWLTGNGAMVSLFHPSWGAAPVGTGKWADRAAYLAGEFGLRPRNLVTGHHGAGFKGMLFEETVQGLGQRSRVYWLIPEVGRLFWRFHQAYVRVLRPRTPGHPFYFTSLSGPRFGEPWTLDATQDLFERTLKKIGLRPSSAQGLCRHAFRHQVSHWMILHGVSPEIRRLVLHHRSIESQGEYDKLAPSQVAASLGAANLARQGNPTGYAEAYAASFPAPLQDSNLDEIARELASSFLRSDA